VRRIWERPHGLVHAPDVVTAPEQERLLGRPGRGFVRRGPDPRQDARRTVRHYGRSQDFESAEIRPGDPIPDWLTELRRRCAEFLGVADERLVERFQRGRDAHDVGQHAATLPAGRQVSSPLARGAA
jgi:hypothetical protein